MKSKLKHVTETYVLSKDDLFDMFRGEILTHKDDPKKFTNFMTRMVNKYLTGKNIPTSENIKFNDDLTEVEVEVSYTVDGDYKPEVPQTKKVDKKNGERGPNTYPGFYKAMKEIIEGLKTSKKNSISYEDFYDKIVNYKAENGSRQFVKNGIPINPDRVKIYISQSQLDRSSLKSMKLHSGGGLIRW
jgi:hypothetical protein